MLVRKLVAVGSVSAYGEWRIDGVTRGAYGTAIAAHAAGVPLVLFRRLDTARFISGLLVPGASLWVKTDPSAGGSLCDLATVTSKPLVLSANLLASITVVSPNGGETLSVGVAMAIRWSASALSGNVAIVLSKDGGATYPTTISSGTANTGMFAWSPGSGDTTTTGIIKISSVVTPSVYDTSDNVFTVASLSTPGAPTGLVARAGNSVVFLSWTAVAGAATYNVKRYTVSGGPYTTLANVAVPSWTDTSAVNGTTYYYVVSALNAASVEGANSSEVSATPSSGTGKYTTLVGDGSTQTWTVTHGLGVTNSIVVELVKVSNGMVTLVEWTTVDANSLTLNFADGTAIPGTDEYRVTVMG